MLISIGTRVKFLHSKDEGVVTALLDNGMVTVLLDGDDMEIPVAADDLIRVEDTDEQLQRIKARIVPGKQEKKKTAPAPPDIETQYTILKSRGIQLAFDPVVQDNSQVEQFQIYLLNDTTYNVLFSYRLELRDQISPPRNGKLPALSYLNMGELLLDHLNDSPTVHLHCWRITTEGTGSPMKRKVRIRPKQFFKRLTTAPLLNRKVHLFKVFEKLNATGASKEEDLRSYTKRKARRQSDWNTIEERFSFDIMEFAEFIPEIDLHVEKLTDDFTTMSNAEILRLQISRFEQYINQAIRLGVERVFIIHGVGKGRLRNAIADRLAKVPDVATFKNEYHPRYGWGATEVIFR